MANKFTYTVAIGLAIIGATVSLSGLVSMFGLAFLPIGAGLEVAKLVAARRLHQGHMSRGLKASLLALVVACMTVTTIGMYGFISRCYTDRIATITQGSDHAVAEVGERIKVAEQQVADLDQQIAKIDNPETKTIKVQVKGRTTETTVPVKTDKTARPALEARRTKAASELADLRVSMAGHQAEQNHVAAEVNTIRAVASMVGLGDDIARAVNILAGILAVMWDPFAVLLLIASVKRIEEQPVVKAATKRKTVRRKARKPRKTATKLAIANDNNVVPFKPAA